MHKPVTAKRMKEIDARAIDDCGIPGIMLMENAGRGVAEAVRRSISAAEGRRKRRIAVFCGKGNNGGDGMVCARRLFSMGMPAKVYLLAEKAALRSDASVQLKILESMGIQPAEIKGLGSIDIPGIYNSTDIIVDAIFGIGFSGRPEGLYKKAIEFINSSPAYKFSVDVPSGLDATTGIPAGVCVKADETLTMGLPKTGLYRNDGPAYAGRVRIIDIGLTDKLKGGRYAADKGHKAG